MEVQPEDEVTFQPEITFSSFHEGFLGMNLHIKILSIIKNNKKSLHFYFCQEKVVILTIK